MAGERPGSSDGSSRNSARPFLTQYLTLMLIILSFMVGSFVTKTVQDSKPVVRVTTKTSDHSGSAVVDTFAIQAVFAPDSAEVSQDKLEALRTVFRSHDLTAEVRVFADAGQTGFNAVNQAVARAFALKRALEVEGIPGQSIRVFGKGEPSGSKAEFTLVAQKGGAP